MYGGVGYGPQLQALRRGVDILVACPGRLEDLIGQGAVDLSAVERVVLDEADRMADMGFMPAVRRILDQTSGQRQTLMFSATLDRDVAKLTRDYQRDPVRHDVGEETPDITSAHHLFWNVARHDRVATTAKAIDAAWPAIVFCRTRHGSDRVARQLSRDGIQAAAIHGGRSQPQRTRALADFAKGRVHALVATDVAARGIHVDGVAAVIHFDPPEDHKAYLHRSGRTARAGQSGVVISLVQPEQVKDLRRIQRQAGLEELFTDPDAVALRELSPVPARTELAAAPATDTADRSRTNSQRSNRSPGSRRRPSRGRSTGDNSRGRPKAKTGKQTQKAKRPQTGKKAHSAKRPQTRKKTQSGQKAQNRERADNRRKSNESGRTGGPNKKSGGHRAAAKTHRGPNRKARRAHLQPGVSA